jgi:type II secretory pathway component PulM
MLTETLTDTTDAIRHTLRDIASEGLDRAPEIVTTNASEAVELARTWAEGVTDHSAEWLADDDHRRAARDWIAFTITGIATFLAAIWLVRWISARRRKRIEQRAMDEVRNLIESNSPKELKKALKKASTKAKKQSESSDRDAEGSRAAS